MIDPSTPTGTCAVCVVPGGERSLVANLAAANNMKLAHVQKPENWAVVNTARVVYSAGFFITVAPDAMMAAATHCCQNDKTYCLNLSAPFIMQARVLDIIRMLADVASLAWRMGSRWCADCGMPQCLLCRIRVHARRWYQRQSLMRAPKLSNAMLANFQAPATSPALATEFSSPSPAPRPPLLQVPPFKKALTELLPYVDYLFANEVEAAAFAESEGWDTTDLAEIALRVRRGHCCCVMEVAGCDDAADLLCRVPQS